MKVLLLSYKQISFDLFVNLAMDSFRPFYFHFTEKTAWDILQILSLERYSDVHDSHGAIW